MNPFPAWIESFLPGVRSVRAPMLSGLLWALLLWVLIADSIPMPPADGWLQQVYALAGWAGVLPSILIVTALVWVLGTLSVGGTQALAWAVTALTKGVRWQYRSRRARNALRKQLANIQEALETVKSQEGPESEGRVKKLTEQHKRLSQRLEKITTSWGFIAKDEDTRKSLKIPVSTEVERELLQNAMHVAMDAEIERRDLNVSVDYLVAAPDYRLGEKLIRDFQPDPLDALRMLDEGLFLAHDRKRTEREVRLSISPPVMALGIVGNVLWGPWLLILTFFGGLMLVLALIDEYKERDRILSQVKVGRLEPPTVLAARVAGRDAVRDFEADQEEKEKKRKQEQAG